MAEILTVNLLTPRGDSHITFLIAYNFSLQYPCTIQQTGYENTQVYQVEVIILI